MMRNKQVKLILILLGTFILGCGSISALTGGDTEPVATPFILEKPHSTFVPWRDNIQVGVEQELILETYHVSNAQLEQLKIQVNGEDSEKMPPHLATVQIFSDEQIVTTSVITPILPTSAWTVSVRWVGHVPGTYSLSMQATDTAQQVGDMVTQQIEVR